MNDTIQAPSVNIKDFFQTSDTLFVDPDFTSWILGNLSDEIPKNKAELVKAFDLSENMSDSQITLHAKTLGFDPKSHPLAPDQIKEMIEAQPNGTEGEMLTNGYSNIFYVVGKDGVLFAVRVRWFSGNGQWRVYAYRLDQGGEWRAGDRVFCNRT